MKAYYFALIGVSVCFGLIGCTQTGGVPDTTSAATAQSMGSNETATSAKPPRVIAKGMEAEEIIRRIGKPTEVNPMPSPDGKAEVWIYRRHAGQQSTLTATSVVQTPVVNPITGHMFTTPEPSYSQERLDLEETTSLLMFNDRLVEWKRTMEGKRAFN